MGESIMAVWGGANDRVSGAIIGPVGRGRLVTGECKETGGELAAACDVYKPNQEAGLKAASSGAKAYLDYGKLLGDKSLDAINAATPDHWHAQMAIDGAHAGKDVYVEKPRAHTPDEKYRMIDAVGTTKRVVEECPQRRSFPHFCEAMRGW